MSIEKTPENREALKKLVDRLCTLPSQRLDGLVDAATIRNELGEALVRAATPDHAERVVERLMEFSDGRAPWRPTAADVREMLKQTPAVAPPKTRAADPACDLCHGDGYVYIERAREFQGIWYSGTRACGCTKVAA